MVQDQLTDYISSQMKLGVSRDAIKAALVSAGWMAVDVDDTLKKVDGGAVTTAASAQPTSKPAQSIGASSMTGGASASPAKAGEPQMIRVSDLVSSSPSSMASSSSSSSPASRADVSKFAGKVSGNTFEATSTSSSMKGGVASVGKGRMIGEIIGGILLIALAGLAWYFYSGNAALATQVASVTDTASSATASVASLQSQFNASSTGFATQIATLTNANADLALNLSFFAVPLDSASATAAIPVTMSGSLTTGGKTPYSIITPRGAKIFIANAAQAAVASQLKPIVGHTVELVGTYIQGSDQMTMTAVTDLSPAPVATTTPATTATTTAPAASPTPSPTSTASSTNY